MTSVFAASQGHEQVVHVQDPRSGLRAIIAIHSTALGPGLGGTRFHPYASEEDALEDVLRLSRAMSYKNALAGLDHGGGKAVVIADTATLVRQELDVYAPCALGGALDDETVEVLTASVVCGGANNQLAHPGVEKLLADRGILYAPDFVVNAGGVIQVADELRGYVPER